MSLIIEIKDLPEGQKIKTIDCKIYFDDSAPVVKVETKVQPQVASRVENVAAEMLDAEF